MKLTRRDHLRQLAAAALANAVPRCVFAQTAGPANAQFPSLLDAAAAVGLAYGSASDNWFRNEPPAYRQLFLRQCALYAPHPLLAGRCTHARRRERPIRSQHGGHARRGPQNHRCTSALVHAHPAVA